MKDNKTRSKDTYYFSHDSNALSDPKILSMRCDYQLEGYGLYWAIIEMLRNESTYKLSLDKTTYRAIQMQTHTKINVEKYIQDCINEYKESSQGNGLFNTEGTYFWSESLLNRMSKMESVREKRSEAGKKSAEKRWGKKEKKKRIIKRPYFDKNSKNITSVTKFITNVTKNNNNVIGMLRKSITKNNKIKENKIKENKLNNNIKTKLNKTKLNNLFIYIINGQKNDENISDIDRTALITCLQNLELYFSDIELLKYLTDEQQLDYELQYWTIKEIYFSPYKIYLNSLTRTKFLLKYLQTKKYILIDNEDKLTDFINYFIKILRKDFEKEENITNGKSM